MASTTAAAIPSTATAPTAAPVATVKPSGISHPTAVASSDGFLRPGSPRKRRRSTGGAESPAKDLEGQVRDKLGISSPPASLELTGAAEMAEQKRRKLEHTSEHLHDSAGKEQSANPRHQALSALRGSNVKPVSKFVDASSPSLMTNAQSQNANAPGSAQTSPISQKSFNTANSVNGNLPQVASPTQIGEHDDAGDEDTPIGPTTGSMQTTSPKSYSYPDPSLSASQAVPQGRRDMSLPGGATSDDTKSPAGNKKHKCPYCETEFTRHHNLKSHLLTHSQEKPFLCGQCEMRFRRLHDLKRHTKLHTGERPHVCPICNRKFARGDALARHTKGAGGCAGHRSSVGSFTNEAGGEGEIVMDSLVYTAEASQEPGEFDENDGPRQNRHPQYQNSVTGSQARAPSTYPPVAASSAQRNGTFLQAPGVHGNGGGSPSTSHTGYGQSGHQGSYPPPSNFGSSGMTESPAPISPSTNQLANTHDSRRASVGTTLQPYTPQSARGLTSSQGGGGSGSGPAPTANMGLPPPQNASSSTTTGNAGPHYPQLHPPLPSITTDARVAAGGVHGHGVGIAGTIYQSGPGSASTHNSISSHGQSSGERGTLAIDERERLWAIIHSLRTELTEVREKQDLMEREVKTLKRAAEERLKS